MQHAAILVIALLATACSTPTEKSATTNNGTTGTTGTTSVTCDTTCPAGLSLVFREDADPCEANDEPGCPTCCVTLPPNPCGNNYFGHAVCPEGLLAVDECPMGESCEFINDCGDEQWCAPLRVIDPTLPTQDGDGPAFTTACSTDEDCALVPAGDVCGCLECPSSSVHVDSTEAYDAVLASGRDRCESITQCGDAPCVEHLPHCDLETGTCVGREAKYVTTEGAPKDCEVATDCEAVFEGEVCDACQCPNTAVRADFTETYQTAFDVGCAHSVACDCAAVMVVCSDNTCAIE